MSGEVVFELERSFPREAFPLSSPVLVDNPAGHPSRKKKRGFGSLDGNAAEE